MSAIRVSLISEFKDAGIKGANKAIDTFASQTKRTLSGIADFGKKVAIGLAGVGAAAGAGAFKAISAASDLSEEISKTGELFGDVTKDVDNFAKTAASRLGQSRTEALRAANTFAIFGKAAGLAGQDLFGFSTDFVALASDLASFNNTSPEQAVLAIGAALRGESEPLRQYGILLDDATLKQKALELGIYDGNGALTQQQKIRAAEIAIYEQSAAAQGDFARTSEGLANQQRILRAEFANVVAQVGEKLLPIALKLAQFFNDKVLPAVQTVADAFSNRGLGGVIDLFVANLKYNGPKILDGLTRFLAQAFEWIRDTGIPTLLDLMQRAGEALINWIRPRIKPMLERLGEFIGDAANWFINEGLPKLVDTLIKLGDALVDWIRPRIVPALLALGELLANILQWIVTEALPKISTQLLKLAAALVSWIIDIIPEVLKALGQMLLSIAKWFVTDGVPGMVKAGADLGKGIITGIGEGLASLVSRLFEFGKSIVFNIVDGIRSVVGSITSTIMSAIPGVGTLTSAVRSVAGILPFAEGGIVTGPTLGLIGEAGPEAVIPLDRLNQFGGGGITINVAGTVVTERDLVEQVRIGLLRAQRDGKQLVA